MTEKDTSIHNTDDTKQNKTVKYDSEVNKSIELDKDSKVAENESNILDDNKDSYDTADLNTDKESPDSKEDTSKKDDNSKSKKGTTKDSINKDDGTPDLEKKVNNFINEEAILDPRLNTMVSKMDLWNKYVRIPVTKWTTERMFINPRETTSSLLRMWKLIVTILILTVIYVCFALYSTPMVLLSRMKITTIGIWVALILTSILWEEEIRLFRKITLYADYLYLKNDISNWLKADWKFKKGFSWLKILLVGGAGTLIAFAMTLGSYVDYTNGSVQSSNEAALSRMGHSAPVLLILIAVFFAPIIEEYVFRGIFFRVFSGININYLKIRKSTRNILVHFGIVCQAFIFSMAHSPNAIGNFLGLVFAGVVLGYVYYRTGKIRYSIYTHLTFNFIVLFVPSIIKLLV